MKLLALVLSATGLLATLGAGMPPSNSNNPNPDGFRTTPRLGDPSITLLGFGTPILHFPDQIIKGKSIPSTLPLAVLPAVESSSTVPPTTLLDDNSGTTRIVVYKAFVTQEMQPVFAWMKGWVLIFVEYTHDGNENVWRTKEARCRVQRAFYSAQSVWKAEVRDRLSNQSLLSVVLDFVPLGYLGAKTETWQLQHPQQVSCEGLGTDLLAGQQEWTQRAIVFLTNNLEFVGFSVDEMRAWL
ncbi:MAG: hypothetical protein M1829_002893 [Trizodia sp. TS-e1964]|nr:MAG: hypothetical protein M1829_002893 [Trizodia sp. TS-e1964]